MENLLSSDADSVHGFPKSIGAYSPLGSGFAYIFLWPIVKFFLNFLPFNTNGAQEWYVALVAGCQCILPYLFRHAWEFFTCSIIISNEQGDVNDIRKWITEHGAGAGQNHVNPQLGRTGVQNGSADLLHEVKKYSAARSTYFRFVGHLVHLERLDKLPDDNRPRMWGPVYPPGTSSGDTVRISTSKGGKNRLEDFVQSVMKAKGAKVKTITTYSVQEFNDCGTKRLYWVRRAVPSRSMNTIDLDQDVKTELIQDFETFVDPTELTGTSRGAFPIIAATFSTVLQELESRARLSR